MRSQDRVQWLLTAALMAVAVAVGGAQGGQGQLGELVCRSLALVLMGWMVLHPRPEGSRPLILPVAITGLFLALPLLQLLPLPGEWWAFNALRRQLSNELLSVQADVPMQLALIPAAAEQALWAMLPALAVAWSVFLLPSAARRRMVTVLLALALLTLLWGIVQRAQGPASPLRLYAFTNLTDATGSFANRNHLATLLLMALPLAMAAAAWATTRRLAGHALSPARVLVPLALTVLLILGIVITRSRSGMLLCVLAIVLSVPLVLSLGRQRGRRRVLLAVVAVGLVLSVQFGLTGILQRLHRNPMQDSRWDFAQTTLQAAQAHAPLGAGLGSFRNAYVLAETEPGALIVNHAHNDWLELWLEGGWPFLLLSASFLAFHAWAGWRIWRARGDDVLLLRTRAAWIGLLLAMLHALVDYSLRTTANMVVFAFLLALLLSGLQATLGSAPARTTRQRPVQDA